MWRQGPLPPDTYFWGGVVTKEIDGQGTWYWCCFRGDHAMTSDEQRIEADEVVWYNNSINEPPTLNMKRTTII
jgi:hypothetical protein